MIEVSYITIETLCHATESEDKVLTVLKRLYPHFEKQEATGHFKNPIYLFKAHITRNKEISALISLLKKKCASQLELDFERRIDQKGNLYVRLDKQELYRGSFVVHDKGEIKIIIHIQSYPFRAEAAIGYAQEIFSN